MQFKPTQEQEALLEAFEDAIKTQEANRTKHAALKRTDPDGAFEFWKTCNPITLLLNASAGSGKSTTLVYLLANTVKKYDMWGTTVAMFNADPRTEFDNKLKEWGAKEWNGTNGKARFIDVKTYNAIALKMWLDHRGLKENEYAISGTRGVPNRDYMLAWHYIRTKLLAHRKSDRRIDKTELRALASAIVTLAALFKSNVTKKYPNGKENYVVVGNSFVNRDDGSGEMTLERRDTRILKPYDFDDEELTLETLQIIAQRYSVSPPEIEDEETGSHIVKGANEILWYSDLMCYDPKQAYDLLGDAIPEQMRNKVWMNFDDTVYYTALDNEIKPKFPIRYFMGDEWQDTSPSNVAVIARLFGYHYNFSVSVLVGDPKQAMYAWRGADVGAFFNASHFVSNGDYQEYSLNGTFRCAKQIVWSVLDIKPEFKALSDREGEIWEVGEAFALDNIQVGDLVVTARRNVQAKIWSHLEKRGVPTYLQNGDELVTGALDKLDSFLAYWQEVKKEAVMWSNFGACLLIYGTEVQAEMEERGASEESIETHAGDTLALYEFYQRIQPLTELSFRTALEILRENSRKFRPKMVVAILSAWTAKGLEAGTVWNWDEYVFRKNGLNGLDDLSNIRYVARTRASERLYLVMTEEHAKYLAPPSTPRPVFFHNGVQQDISALTFRDEPKSVPQEGEEIDVGIEELKGFLDGQRLLPTPERARGGLGGSVHSSGIMEFSETLAEENEDPKNGTDN